MGGEAIWACCSCGSGPNLVAVHICCTECQHVLCSNCDAEGTNNNKFDILPVLQFQSQFRAAQDSEPLATNRSLAFGKDYSSSAFAFKASAFKASLSSSSAPFDSDDIKYEDGDTLEARLSEYVLGNANVSVESSSDEEVSTWTDSPCVSEELEVIIPYNGPLRGLKAEALSLILDAYEQFRSPGNGDTISSTTSTEDPAADNASDDTRPSEGQSSNSSRLKRKHSDRDENDDGGEKNRKPSRKRVPFAQDPEEQSLLACPFYKFNPQKHRSCYRKVLRTVTRVKSVTLFLSIPRSLNHPRQHLDRRHQIPKHCPACFKEFETEDHRVEHSRVRPSCKGLPEKTWDGVSVSQKERLKARFSPKKSPEENWYIVFEILFPGAPRPRSPCKPRIILC
jgi:hypothetical protein